MSKHNDWPGGRYEGMKAFGGHQLLAGGAVALPLEKESGEEDLRQGEASCSEKESCPVEDASRNRPQ